MTRTSRDHEAKIIKMNLQEFIDYKKNCPMCHSPLRTYLHSLKRQSIKWEDNRMIIIFPLRNIDNSILAENVGYSFDLLNNKFCIEFYNKDLSMRLETISFHLIDKFISLHENLVNYVFYRRCDSCAKYFSSSNSFNLDFKESLIKYKLPPLSVQYEDYNFYQYNDNGKCRTYKLINMHSTLQSDLYCWNNNDQMHHRKPRGYIKLPLIPFVSTEETFSRILKLLVFS